MNLYDDITVVKYWKETTLSRFYCPCKQTMSTSLTAVQPPVLYYFLSAAGGGGKLWSKKTYKCHTLTWPIGLQLLNARAIFKVDVLNLLPTAVTKMSTARKV